MTTSEFKTDINMSRSIIASIKAIDSEVIRFHQAAENGVYEILHSTLEEKLIDVDVLDLETDRTALMLGELS